LRKVPLPYGSRGEWPYEALSWTTDGIVASNQSGSITVAGATVLVRDKTVTDEAPITGIYRVPLSTDGYVTSASGGSNLLELLGEFHNTRDVRGHLVRSRRVHHGALERTRPRVVHRY